MWIGTALTQHRLCNNKSATGTTTMTAMMMMYDNSENDASECSVHNEHIGPQQMWTMNIRIVEQKIKKKEWQHRQNAMYSICASHKHNQQATTSFCVSMKFFFYTRFFCCWLNECWMLWNLGCGERNTHTHTWNDLWERPVKRWTWRTMVVMGALGSLCLAWNTRRRIPLSLNANIFNRSGWRN